jgi:hypothetical protein
MHRLTVRVRAVVVAALAEVAVVVVSSSAEAAPTTYKQARQIGAQAYAYGLAVLNEERVISGFPANTLLNITQLATPAEQLIVLPNNDTLYTNARFDLSAGPIVIHVPAERGRYYVLQFLDAYTNTFAYIGRRTTGTQAGDFALTPPGWQGTLPAGVKRISAPTPTVWMLGRTLVNGPNDVTNVIAIQHGYTATPLSNFGGTPNPAVFLTSALGKSATLPTGLAFYDAMDAVMVNNPPPKSEQGLMRRFASVGIGPGRTPSTEPLSSAVRNGLIAGVGYGRQQVKQYASRTIAGSLRVHNGWLVPPAATGNYGSNYLLRAYIAEDAIGANRPVEALYPVTGVDNQGGTLTGSHRYVLHSPKGELPPVKAFWSLTMYNQNLFLINNPLGRYSIGNRTTGLKRNRDGSLDILLQATRPKHNASNWLPAPKGKFELTLRLYNPTPSVLKGGWSLPTITRVS